MKIDKLDHLVLPVSDIDRIAEHLPLEIPRSEVAIAYSGPSEDAFDFNNITAAETVDREFLDILTLPMASHNLKNTHREPG